MTEPMQLDFDGELSYLDKCRINNMLNRKHKGMANRATYQDMAIAIGSALGKTRLDMIEIKELACNISRSLHYRREPTCAMSIDGIVYAAEAIRRTPNWMRRRKEYESGR